MKFLKLAVLFILASCAFNARNAHAAVFNLYGPIAGVQVNSGLTYQNTAAGPTDIQGIFTGCGAGTLLPGTGGACVAAFTPASPGPIGGTTPSTGAFTDLSSSGVVSGTGFVNRFATPGPIGNTVASTGAFTSVTASSTISANNNGNAITVTGDAAFQMFRNTATTAVADLGTVFAINGSGSTADFLIASNTNFNIATGNSSTFTVTMSSAGAVGLPKLAASSAATTGSVCWTTATGNLTVDTTTTCLLSSRRFKQDVQTLSDADGLFEVMRLRPVAYTLKPAYNPQHLGRQLGLIAEEVRDVDPRLVGTDEAGDPRAVRYQQLSAVLVKAIQEQQREILALKREIRGMRRDVVYAQ